MEFINYIIENQGQIISLTIEHIKLVTIAVALAIVIGVPTGILISYVKKLNKPVLGLANIVQAIPSMALLGFTIPLLGIGTLPAIVMVVLYSLLPIIKNTYIGIQNISSQTLEAATGIGLTKWQILTKIQIPLALPVIMGGIRISAVSAVGLMTLAAFVGASGLGYLIYAGIRSVNNMQILAGAIPACILALLMDWIIGMIENLVTPKNMRNQEKISFFKKPLVQKIILGFFALVMIALLISNFFLNQKAERQITIGSMDFSEQEVLSYMVKELIEDRTDITVKQKLSLGSSSIVLGAIQENHIDMYIDYTGTIYGSVLKHDPNSNADEVYETSKKELKEKYDLNILTPLGFNNTYTLAVKKELCDQYQLKTISDLSLIANQLTFSPTITCMERKDCWLGLQNAYSLDFQNIVPIDGAPRYTALINGDSDVIDAYSTDGLLQKFDLVILEDDQNFFLPYHAIPVVNNNVLNHYSDIIPILEELGEHLDDETMRNLNYQVDEMRRSPSEVAKTFLKEEGLI